MTIKQAQTKADKITDRLGMPIDRGIKKVVIGLWLNGIETTGSCQGHLRQGLPYPWVDISTPQQEKSAWKKANALQRKQVESLINEFHSKYNNRYPLVLDSYGRFGAFRMQNKGAFDQDKPDKNLLARYREVMNDFADFLIQKKKDPAQLK